MELGPSHIIFQRDMTSLPRSNLNCIDMDSVVKEHELIGKFTNGCKSVLGKPRSITKLVATLSPAAVLLEDCPIGMQIEIMPSKRTHYVGVYAE